MAESDGSCSPVDIPFEASSDEEGSVAAYFPDDFKQYVDTQLNRCPLDDYGWVFWSREDDQSEHPPNFLDFKKKIKDVLLKCIRNWFGYPTLFQLWAPTMTMERRSYLTTQNQPFALCSFDTRIDDAVKGLCGYRMISEGYKFYMDRESSDEQLGVPGRVFKHGFPEFSPNVEYYSIKENPLRDNALGCQLKLSWAIPLFDPSTHFCVGVLEIVSTGPTKESVLGSHIDLLDLHNYLEEVGLESSPGVDHQQIRQLSSNRPFSHASAAVVHANPCNTLIQDANIVTVKAYIDDIIIKFPLSLSSGLVELQQKIAHILHLEDGTYYVKYKDEDDDLIVLACDQEELKHYISASTSPGQHYHRGIHCSKVVNYE
ncbi:protein NLP7-like isoform X2 [Camellia sinensis]|uniref:protein NLP7-like isoform X2 n=1 Tax=Camellia sinensis TaxID=4442 RepID=UPI001036F175|nr:protein NLP7-like isoform X2 [Camellia sinensis]